MGYVWDNDGNMMGYGIYGSTIFFLSIVGYRWEYTGYTELDQRTYGIQATEMRDV